MVFVYIALEVNDPGLADWVRRGLCRSTNALCSPVSRRVYKRQTFNAVTHALLFCTRQSQIANSIGLWKGKQSSLPWSTKETAFGSRRLKRVAGVCARRFPPAPGTCRRARERGAWGCDPWCPCCHLLSYTPYLKTWWVNLPASPPAPL